MLNDLVDRLERRLGTIIDKSDAVLTTVESATSFEEHCKGNAPTQRPLTLAAAAAAALVIAAAALVAAATVLSRRR